MKGSTQAANLQVQVLTKPIAFCARFRVTLSRLSFRPLRFTFRLFLVENMDRQERFRQFLVFEEFMRGVPMRQWKFEKLSRCKWRKRN